MSSTVKRSRIARSSSLGDFAMVDQLMRRYIDQPPLVRLVKKQTTSPLLLQKKPPSKPVDQPPRKRTILTIGSPERDEIGNAKSESKEEEEEDDDDHDERGGVGGFCEKCFSCKKKIGEKDNVFMYSYLRAFCSPKCRDKQITLDKKDGKAPDDSSGSNGIESQWKLKIESQWKLKMKNDVAALTKFV